MTCVKRRYDGHWRHVPINVPAPYLERTRQNFNTSFCKIKSDANNNKFQRGVTSLADRQKEFGGAMGQRGEMVVPAKRD